MRVEIVFSSSRIGSSGLGGRTSGCCKWEFGYDSLGVSFVALTKKDVATKNGGFKEHVAKTAAVRLVMTIAVVEIFSSVRIDKIEKH